MQPQNQVLPLLDIQTIKAIDLHLEEIYETEATQMLGKKMVQVGLKSSQVRGLENLVMSTRRFSEIVNYVKNQAGKDSKGQWPQIVNELLKQLEQLEGKAKEIGKGDPGLILEIRKRLARGWVKQIVAHYLFIASFHGEDEYAGERY
jgi:hypothetical protein